MSSIYFTKKTRQVYAITNALNAQTGYKHHTVQRHHRQSQANSRTLPSPPINHDTPNQHNNAQHLPSYPHLLHPIHAPITQISIRQPVQKVKLLAQTLVKLCRVVIRRTPVEAAVVKVLLARAAGREVCAGDLVRVAEATGEGFGVVEGAGGGACVHDGGCAVG